MYLDLASAASEVAWSAVICVVLHRSLVKTVGVGGGGCGYGRSSCSETGGGSGGGSVKYPGGGGIAVRADVGDSRTSVPSSIGAECFD